MKTAIDSFHKADIRTLPTKETKLPYCPESWLAGIDDIRKYDGAHGLAIVCGKASGGVECLDFDNHFGDAKEIISEFIKECKHLYDRHKFPIETTVNGGFHLIYKCLTVEGNQKLASRPRWVEKENRFKPDCIIETRGEGGYFVCAPTPGYSVIRNDIYSIPEITAGERAELLLLAKTFNQWHEIKPTEHESKDRPGDMFNRSSSCGSEAINALKRAGWHEVSTGKWRRSGKNEGISATFGKVAENIFYCFTSNGFPFEPNRAYTPFQVIALLDYSGDFKECARSLAEKYEIKQPERKQYAKKEDKIFEENRLDEILRTSHINLKIPVTRPPVAVKIIDFENNILYKKRLFTLGNFSAITGKSKSKKTYFASILLAAATKGGEVFRKIEGTLPQGKDGVLLFDTEQSNYDAFISAHRVWRMIGEYDNYGAFDLREYTPLERCQIIDYALQKMGSQIGFVLIDGIADLANANNDEEEAVRVVSLLMKWTKLYNTHICVIIHQNKNDNYATGHLGSAILKKAECIISIEKNKEDSYRSIVRCDMIRGVSDFKDFEININKETHLPEIDELINLATTYEQREYDGF